MSIATMQKVEIFGLKRQQRQVLDLLQDMGAMEICDVSSEAVKLDREIGYDGLLSDLEFAISFLETFEEKEGGFLKNLGGAEDVMFQEIKDKVSKIDFKLLIRECRDLESELMNLNELVKNLERERDLLEPWKNFEAPLADLDKSRYVTITAGTLPPKTVEVLSSLLEPYESSIEIVEKTKPADYVLVAYSIESEEEIVKLLVENGFSQIRLPVSGRTPAGEMDNIDVSLRAAEKRRRSIKNVAARLAKNRFGLMLVYDFFLQKKAQQNAEKKLSLSTYTFMVSGWIKKRELKKIGKKLAAFFPESHIVSINPGEGEEAPVAIENPGIIKPFEAVSNIYGLPAYKEVDPTPLLSVFFIVFFGLCLGDAGYGITLSMVAYFFYKKVGPNSGASKLLKLLIYGGITTFIAGVLTGGWFGVEPTEFPAFLKPAQDFLMSIRVISPVDNPIGMLIVALAFGFVQIIFGISINFYVKVRDKAYLDAIFDDALWIYFLIVLTAFGIQKASVVHISNNLVWFVVGGIAALVLTQGRREKNIVLRLAKGVLSLYGTIGYLSDTLSYSRILALGMATSVIAMVVNMIAMMTKDVPYLGYVIMTLVLIAGHTFNLAINVLGSFIHSSRLQFVEFFSKFLHGGGTEFDPLKRETKFVKIKL